MGFGNMGDVKVFGRDIRGRELRVFIFRRFYAKQFKDFYLGFHLVLLVYILF